MNDTPMTDAVARQYDRFSYPAPISDLTGSEPDSYYPAIAYRKYWPRLKSPPRGLDILVAGCGTNQAAHLAFHERDAKIVGIDVSDSSLEHAEFLKNKHRLDNLQLIKLPIEDSSTLGKNFDVVLSTGVLHHLANPQRGMNELAKLLRPTGVALIMLYAKYGHLGVSTMQSFFRLLRVNQDEAGLRLVRDTLAHLLPDHPVRTFLAADHELNDDTGLIDIFLQARLTTYTVPDCLAFVASAGLAFQGWFDQAPYNPEYFMADGPTLKALSSLGSIDKWHAMEMLFTANACHSFIACRRDRPSWDYVIDFASTDAAQFIVGLNPGVKLTDGRLHRGDRFWPLDAAQMRLALGADGVSPIRDVIQRSGISGGTAELERHAMEFFSSLWRLGVLTVGLP